jgi:hypothetical protein
MIVLLVKDNMKNFDIKWIATALFIFGGTTVAFKFPWIPYAFPCFFIAHAILLYDFMKSHKNKALVFQNFYFLIINIYATYNWFVG